KCEKYSIFISQAQIPIKGLHKILDAVALIKNEFPEIKIYIAGNNFTKTENFIDRLRLTGYGKYILSLIKKYNLTTNVFFTGELNENEMIDRYLKSNLFICPSSIENSPNSLGEAQILGVPCIASYVGGVPDMIKDGETGFLYRFEEIKMLALRIAQIFNMSQNELEQLSNSEKEVALQRHNPTVNIKTLLDIYTQCL
ncbi:MAG: glycosyl transferase family 1, partial [Bacteroidetes bacterium HGW-Bacteroidetes-20]